MLLQIKPNFLSKPHKEFKALWGIVFCALKKRKKMSSGNMTKVEAEDMIRELKQDFEHDPNEEIVFKLIDLLNNIEATRISVLTILSEFRQKKGRIIHFDSFDDPKYF